MMPALVSFCPNLDLSVQRSPYTFSQQFKLNVAKPDLLILTPKGLSLISFSECRGKYPHHLIFSPVNSVAFFDSTVFSLVTSRVTPDPADSS